MKNDKNKTMDEESVCPERLPHKFCPKCGFRNEAMADKCEQCGKDISWMKIPEPLPPTEIIKEKPRSEPKRERIFSMRAILLFLLIFLLLVALIVAMIVVGKSRSGESSESAFMEMPFSATGYLGSCSPELTRSPPRYISDLALVT